MTHDESRGIIGKDSEQEAIIGQFPIGSLAVLGPYCSHKIPEWGTFFGNNNRWEIAI